MKRVRALLLGGLGAVISALPTHAAQDFPTRPLRLVVPFVAGGGTDVLARAVAQKLGESVRQTVVVDNRAGAGGIIGTELVAKSAPDGYTLLMGSAGPMAVNPSLYARLPYNVERDFAPVTLLTVMPFLLVVNPSVAATNVSELIALAKAKPGSLSFASPGTGSVNHLAGELLKLKAGIDLVHVPYKGVAPATTDLIAGQIQVMSGDLNTLLPQVKAGRLRALAVTSARRSSLLPELPPVADAVPGFDLSGWFGILAPAATPVPLITRLNQELRQAVNTSEVRARVAALGGEVIGNTPAQFRVHIREETAKWAHIIRSAKVRADAGQ